MKKKEIQTVENTTEDELKMTEDELKASEENRTRRRKQKKAKRWIRRARVGPPEG